MEHSKLGQGLDDRIVDEALDLPNFVHLNTLDRDIFRVFWVGI